MEAGNEDSLDSSVMQYKEEKKGMRVEVVVNGGLIRVRL
jgi:hypothetical protein